MKLLKTIRSTCNSNKVYGNAGDPVKLVIEKGVVWIVEDDNGNRFPVLKCEVSKDDKAPITIEEAIPDAVAKNKIIKKGVGVRTKAAPTNQKTLF